ncbi:hypothetical protein B0H13DRAFT_2290031 [Mycena leptocephala]|nr:hypothetical protein B0H13DRAFT_2290031 [Mycena leptocephala]
MFEAAGDISQGDIKAYRRFAFPRLLGIQLMIPSSQSKMHPTGSHPLLVLGIPTMLHQRKSDPIVIVWPGKATSIIPSSVSTKVNLGSVFSPFKLIWTPFTDLSTCTALGTLRLPLSFANGAIVISDDEHSPLAALAPPLMAPKLERASPLPPVAAVAPSAKKRKGKQKAGQPGIRLTRELAVDEIVSISTIPATWTVPRIHTAYLVDLHDSQELLKVGKRMVTIDGFIRAEDQDSWSGSGGHSKVIRPSLLIVRYEPDEEAMRALWMLEIEANEREAASAPGKIARFYVQIKLSRCKIACDGVPIIKEYLNNNGRLPGPPLTLNEKCPLTVHPRIGKGLQHCPYSHIINGQIMVARIVQRKCPTEMIIFVPVEQLNPDLQKALIFLRNPHNHPAHPKTKPSANDKLTLGKAVEAAGIVGLTAQRLLNASSTALVYTGERVAAVSPAFMDNRREYPRGMGWDGVLHHLSTKEPSLLKPERYIHTAMSKNGFRLVVTMHPQIASHIHSTLALNIDFTFKRVDGEMNERPLDNAQTVPDASLIENEEDADLSGGVEIETDSSLNFQVEPAGTDVTDILHYKYLPQRSERQIWDSSFNISSFLSSSADFLDSNPQFQQPGITDNDLGLNPYISTEEFLSYLDNLEFLRNLEMGATSSNMEADLPQLPMPTPSSPIAESSDLPSAYPEIQGQRKKHTREPEVDEANIVAGPRQRTKSRRALGE